jgi:hypothetical protein
MQCTEADRARWHRSGPVTDQKSDISGHSADLQAFLSPSARIMLAVIVRQFAQLAEEAGLSPDLGALVVDVVELGLAAERSEQAGDLGDLMRTLARVRARLEGVAAVPTAAFAESGRWSLDNARSAPGWLAAYTGMSRRHAGAAVKTARDLTHCPFVAGAQRSGRLSPAKVSALLAVRTPKVLDVFREHEDYLVETIIPLTVAGAEVFLRAWANRAAPDGGDGDFDEASGRTTFRLSRTHGGCFDAQGWFDPVSGATLLTAIEREIADWRRAGVLNDDDRTYGQLMAAALVALVARGSVHAAEAGKLRPLFLGVVDITDLVERQRPDPSQPAEPDQTNGPATPAERAADGRLGEIVGVGPLPVNTLKRLLCNSDLSRVVVGPGSVPIDVGRTSRAITPAIRRAVIVRSGGFCEVCHQVAAQHCDFHHIDFWVRDNGPTSEANTVLVCARDHHALHEGNHTLIRGPDGFQLRRPDGTLIPKPDRHRPVA